MYSWVDPEITEVSRCNHRRKPIEVRSCSVPSCNATFVWGAGPWAQVWIFNSSDSIYLKIFQCLPNKQCGEAGRQRRPIFCQNTNGKKVSKKKCRLEHGNKFKPQRKRQCEITVCGYKSCNDIREVRHTETLFWSFKSNISLIFREFKNIKTVITNWFLVARM